ncbi:MAG: LPS export ABC transporter permease LptG [Alphaproteobacteria bacterium]
MAMPRTLSRYIGRQFLTWFFIIILSMIAVILLVDIVELLRRASGKPDATLSVVFIMALLRLPHLTQEATAFAILFGALLCFVRLTRTHELVVMRAAGMSVWQFVFPAVYIATVIGLTKIMIINPAAAVMLSKAEEMEGRYLTGSSSLLAVSTTGVWLRQIGADGKQAVIHAPTVSPQRMELHGVTVFLYADEDRFEGRIDADTAVLRDGFWEFHNAWLTGPDRPGQFVTTHSLPTDLTPAKIQESFASPETVSFWQLPRFINVTEATGFSAEPHRLRWHTLLAEPLLLAAMVLIAATFSLRPARRGRSTLFVAAGVLSGFAIYIMTNIIHALGLGSSVPLIFAAWMPAGFTASVGISMLLHQEDG